MKNRFASRSGRTSTQVLEFSVKLFIFASIAVLTLLTYNHEASTALKALNGPSTAEQINESFHNALARKYDCLLLGNSRLYRGINPDLFWSDTYNFSHDNDSFNQDYFKLMYLEQHNVNVKYLVLGVDYFEFSFLASSRNYVYGGYLGDEYLRDFHDSWNDRFNSFMSLRFTRTFPIVMSYWIGLATGHVESNRSYLKPNGQFIAAFHKSREWWRDTVKRDSSRLPLEEAYFDKILAYTFEHKIETVLVMPPTRADELESYDALTLKQYDELFEQKARQFNATYLNYSTNGSFALDDFMDATHLTPDAADRFSRMLSRDFAGLVTNRNADLSNPNRNNY